MVNKMSKVDIDYSNTLFYKISCNDTNITDLYIGHTTNFVQRKYGHKQACNNPKYANYNCKVYNVIRHNGGWDNWRMDIIAYHECKDHYEARKKEQEYFILYNATLNSIEPMPRPKCVNNQTPSNANDVKSKYECKPCDYKCCNKYNFTKHCLTNKHNAIINCNNAIPKIFSCHCGCTYKHRPSYYRHKKNCIKPDNEPIHLHADKPFDPIPHIDTALLIELLKQNQEFKSLMLEQSKQLAEQQNQMAEQQNQMAEKQLQLLEAVKDGKFGNNNCNNNNTTNNKFNLNVFLNETCKDAISMDDFINSIEVTRDEFIHTGQVGFVEGISTVMAHRFRDMEMHTRPLHCTDLKRETIYIKNADKWEKDDADKTNMRKAVRGRCQEEHEGAVEMV
jgi:hypothetical protein